jgi:protein-tyrosine phosphatase
MADQDLSLFHRAFDKLYPTIRFVHETIGRNAWFSQITPRLWLGGAPTYDRDYEFIRANGITAVVNIRAEREDDVSYYARHGIDHVRFAVPDTGVPDAATISRAVTWTRRELERGRTVLIHCAKGRGRSATLLAAYLMLYEEMSFDQANDLMRSRRRLTKLEDRHRRALEAWIAEVQSGDGSPQPPGPPPRPPALP